MPRALWRRAGELGLLLTGTDERWGGLGVDFLYSYILTEEMAFAGATGPLFYLHSDIVAPYVEHYGSDAQRAEWLPRLASGEVISGIAMTEPGTGSDLQGITTSAQRDGDDWVLKGQKIFISNGQTDI